MTQQINHYDDIDWFDNEFMITTRQEKFSLDAIHQFLTSSTWAEGIDYQTVELSVRNSLCFGLFIHEKQIGFARLVTDWATFGYLCDVYILEEWRGKKLANWLMDCCHQHPLIKNKLRRIMLVTSTAPWLYEKAGYEPINRPNFVWHINRPDIYKSPK